MTAAFVSGIAALALERNPALKPDEVRSILTGTARDLGAAGRDDLFGAGQADAFAAVSAVGTPAVPPAPAAPTPDNTSVSRVMEQPAPSMAADKSAENGAKSPATR